MFDCLIYLKPHEAGRVRRQTGGTVSPRMLLESQAMSPGEAAMLFRGKDFISLLHGENVLPPEAHFRVPADNDQQAHNWSRGGEGESMGLIKRASGWLPSLVPRNLVGLLLSCWRMLTAPSTVQPAVGPCRWSFLVPLAPPMLSPPPPLL